jgi:hypothetical protein
MIDSLGQRAPQELNTVTSSSGLAFIRFIAPNQTTSGTVTAMLSPTKSVQFSFTVINPPPGSGIIYRPGDPIPDPDPSKTNAPHVLVWQTPYVEAHSGGIIGKISYGSARVDSSTTPPSASTIIQDSPGQPADGQNEIYYGSGDHIIRRHYVPGFADEDEFRDGTKTGEKVWREQLWKKAPEHATAHASESDIPDWKTYESLYGPGVFQRSANHKRTYKPDDDEEEDDETGKKRTVTNVSYTEYKQAFRVMARSPGDANNRDSTGLALEAGRKMTFIPQVNIVRFNDLDDDTDNETSTVFLDALDIIIPPGSSTSVEYFPGDIPGYDRYFPAEENTEVTLTLLPVEISVVNRDDPAKTWTTGPVTSGPLAYTSPTIPEVSDVKNGDLIRWEIPGLPLGLFAWWAEGPNGSRKEGPSSHNPFWKIEDPIDWLPGAWDICCRYTKTFGDPIAATFRFKQNLGYRSPHITVIGWINGDEIILPDGSDHPIQHLVPTGTGPTPVSIETIMTSFVSRNNFLSELVTGASYVKPLAPDGARRYVNSYLIKFSPNVEPQSDFTVDWPGKANRKMVDLTALRAFKADKRLFRAFHQFQVRFELDESAKIKGEPVYLIPSRDTTECGYTPTDIVNLSSEIGPLNNKIVKAGESLEINPKNRRTLTAELPNEIAQINQGRISTLPIIGPINISGGHVSKQLNNLVVPWIWSMITFSSSYASSGSTQVPQNEIFPSYHVLYNGRRIDSLTQHISSEKIEEFIRLGEAP